MEFSEVVSYFNPLSDWHSHTTDKWSELSGWTKLGIVAATIIATPFLGVGGLAMFRALTERSWNYMHQTSYIDVQQNDSKSMRRMSFATCKTLKDINNFVELYFFQQRVQKSIEESEK